MSTKGWTSHKSDSIILTVSQHPPPVPQATTKGAGARPAAAPAALRRPAAGRTIVTPNLRQRTDVPLSHEDPESDEMLDTPFPPMRVKEFKLPSSRIPAPLPGGASTTHAGKRPLLYTMDGTDRAWLAKHNHTLMTSGGGFGGKTSGKPPSALVDGRVDSVLQPGEFQRIVTALEIAADEKNSNASTGPTMVTSAHCGKEGESSHFDEVRTYWLRKRSANGGVPLIPELVPAPREGESGTFCTDFALGDCPLPFCQRDGTDTLLRRKPIAEAQSRNKSLPDFPGLDRADLDECKAVTTRYMEAATSTLENVMLRELKALKHVELTLYELACMRNAALIAGQNQRSPVAAGSAVYPANGTTLEEALDQPFSISSASVGALAATNLSSNTGGTP